MHRSPNPLPYPSSVLRRPISFLVMEEGTYNAYAGLPPSQSPPFSDDGQMGSLLSDILPHLYYPQVNAEAYTTGLSSSSQFGPIQGMGGAWMPYYEPPPFPSTLPGHEGVPHAWLGDSAYAKVAEVDAIHNSGQHNVSTSALDQSHLCTHADTGPNFSASPILRIPSISTVGQYEEGTSRNRPIQSPQMTEKRTTASSRLSGRPARAHDAPKQSYACAICSEEYTQMQGLMRHYRTKHHPRLCLFCDFKWGRPEHYRNHLTKRHELDVAVVDGILGKPAGSRRRTTVIGRDLPQNVSPPAIKHDRRAQPKPRQRRLMPPLSSMAKVTHVTSPFSSTEGHDVVDHVPRLSSMRPGGSTLADRTSSRALRPYSHTRP